MTLKKFGSQIDCPNESDRVRFEWFYRVVSGVFNRTRGTSTGSEFDNQDMRTLDPNAGIEPLKYPPQATREQGNAFPGRRELGIPAQRPRRNYPWRPFKPDRRELSGPPSLEQSGAQEQYEKMMEQGGNARPLPPTRVDFPQGQAFPVERRSVEVHMSPRIERFWRWVSVNVEKLVASGCLNEGAISTPVIDAIRERRAACAISDIILSIDPDCMEPPCYEVTPCGGGDAFCTTTNVIAHSGRVIEVGGICHSVAKCVDAASAACDCGTCSPTQAVTVGDTYANCAACEAVYPPCYLLTACDADNSNIHTTDDMSSHVGSVVAVGNQCYTVSLVDSADCTSAVSVTVQNTYANCAACEVVYPPPPTYTCNDRCGGCCFADEMTIEVAWNTGYVTTTQDTDCPTDCNEEDTGSLTFTHSTDNTTCNSGGGRWQRTVGDFTYTIDWNINTTGAWTLLITEDGANDPQCAWTFEVDGDCCGADAQPNFVRTRDLKDALCNTGNVTSTGNLQIVVNSSCCWNGSTCVEGSINCADGDCL